MIPPLAIHLAVGATLVATSIPLALGKVPMNRVYGIRLRKAFASDRAWYAINGFGGRLLAAYGAALIAFGILFRHAAPPRESPWTALFVAGPIAGMLVIVAVIAAYARRVE